MKTAFRYLQKNLSFTVINVVGLTAGIGAFLLIALFVQNELSYDEHIQGADHLYRLVGIQEPSGLDKQHVAITSGGWAEYIHDNIPDVQEAFRIMWAQSTIEVNDEAFSEMSCYSEGRMVEHLGLPFISGGEPSEKLARPNTAVISEEAALRVFNTPDVVGETFRHLNRPYTITGVYDNKDILSHLQFHVVLSLSTIENDSPWLNILGNNSLATYLVVQPGADIENVEQIINTHYEQTGQSGQRQMNITFYLQNVKDIYLRSGHLKFQLIQYEGNIKVVYIFILVAILVLGIACINFINLATANSAKRAREVGVRKVMGATRSKLALQLIGESMVLTLGAILLSLVLLEVMIPEFNTLLGTRLRIDLIGNPLFNVGLLAILVVVGLVSGLYPGLVLSRFQATEALKSTSMAGKPQAAWLRKILVIFQFSVSTVLIVATIVVMNQTSFMQSKDRGYRPEQVIFLQFPEGTGYEQMDGFRNHLLGFPEVTAAGIASNYNGVAGQQSDIVVADSVETRLMTRYGYVDPDFFPAMGIDIVRGRNFSHEAGTDITQAAIINEATWQALGWEEPLGQRIRNTYYEDVDYFTVIGVIRDYNYYSLHNPIEPAIYLFQPDQMLTMNIRFQGSEPQAFTARLEKEFKKYFPGRLFSSRLVEEILERQTRNEKNMACSTERARCRDRSYRKRAPGRRAHESTAQANVRLAVP
ncbi:MAG: ABC transporter permease, partial [Bacteroidales bacterium]